MCILSTVFPVAELALSQQKKFYTKQKLKKNEILKKTGEKDF